MTEEPKEEQEKPEEEETTLDIKTVNIEGCASDEAKEVIAQMLERRLAELPPEGQKAKFVMNLMNEVKELPTCQDLLGDEKTADES